MKFGIGKWKMVNGLAAHVVYELPEPRKTDYVLRGYCVMTDGVHYPTAWTRDGTCYVDDKSISDYDLVGD